MPAKIIEPATGASTWAFGNHKWTIYKGVLTRNAKIVTSHQKFINWLEIEIPQ
jgi:hypothetical protein